MTPSQLLYGPWYLLIQNKNKLHIIWFVKRKNSDKIDQNTNLAVICHKQDILVIIYLFIEETTTPAQLWDSWGFACSNM